MTRKTFIGALKNIGACQEAQEYVKATKGTPAQLWAKCKHQDWLFWLAGRFPELKLPIILAACDIARSVLVHVPYGEGRPLAAIEAAEAWVRDPSEANRQKVRVASYAASAASEAAYDAAYAASNAAYAASEAASAASAASSAAYAASNAAFDAAYYAASAASNAAYYTAFDAASDAASYVADVADAACAASRASVAAQQAKNRRLIRKHITWGMVERALTKKKSNQ
jgi:hypothetical protein